MDRLPVVAIVGRPNTGKSTLFNRLVREQIAIVSDIPGTTRDRLSVDISWGEYSFTLLDTGGIDIESKDDIINMSLEQAEIAISNADVIIFVVDVVAGPIPPDYETAKILRMSGRPVVLAVNKVDNFSREKNVVEFYEFSLGDPVPISAHHGIGIRELMDQVTSLLPQVTAEPDEDQLKVAVVGRPNVGKSMLVNAVIGEERVIVSPIPGTTRDAIDTVFDYSGKKVVFIDTAGLRRRGKVDRGIERYSVLRSRRAIERANVAVVVTEPEELMAAQDMHVAGYAQESHKSLVIAVNKWDLAEDLELIRDEALSKVRQRMRFLPQVPVVFVSAKYKRGIDRLLEQIIAVGEERRVRVPTSTLNDIAHDAFARHTPSIDGRQAKLYYATQVGIDPPTFVFFVNDASLIHFSYRRYIENRLRAIFGFHGTPLHVIFRGREGR